MFDFLDMIGNHAERMVGHYEEGEVFVDTALVTDANEPYETAVAHPNYNEGEIVIVEMYPYENLAKEGHEKWVKIMTAKELPSELVDVGTSAISKACDAIDNDASWRIRKER